MCDSTPPRITTLEIVEDDYDMITEPIEVTADDVYCWLDDKRNTEYTHMIVLQDTEDGEIFPTYVKEKTSFKFVEEWFKANGPHFRILEVYSYARDLDEQIVYPGRVYNWS